MICGAAGDDTRVLDDSGIGDLSRTEFKVWIEPLPADDARPCGSIREPDHLDGNAFRADPGEPQGDAVVAARGGDVEGRAELTLAIERRLTMASTTRPVGVSSLA